MHKKCLQKTSFCENMYQSLMPSRSRFSNFDFEDTRSKIGKNPFWNVVFVCLSLWSSRKQIWNPAPWRNQSLTEVEKKWSHLQTLFFSPFGGRCWKVMIFKSGTKNVCKRLHFLTICTKAWCLHGAGFQILILKILGPK